MLTIGCVQSGLSESFFKEPFLRNKGSGFNAFFLTLQVKTEVAQVLEMMREYLMKTGHDYNDLVSS